MPGAQWEYQALLQVVVQAEELAPVEAAAWEAVHLPEAVAVLAAVAQIDLAGPQRVVALSAIGLRVELELEVPVCPAAQWNRSAPHRRVLAAGSSAATGWRQVAGLGPDQSTAASPAMRPPMRVWNDRRAMLSKLSLWQFQFESTLGIFARVCLSVLFGNCRRESIHLTPYLVSQRYLI